MTIDDRIRDHLHTQADRLPTETAPLPELPRRPRLRTALAAAAVVTAVVLLAVGIGQMILPTTNDVVDQSESTTPTTAPDGSRAAPSTVVTVNDLPEATTPVPGITWERHELDLDIDGVYHVLDLARLGNRLFASVHVEGPNRTIGVDELWTTVDGLAWEPLATAPSGRLLAADGYLTIVSENDDGSLTIHVSRDGSGWTPHVLEPAGLNENVPYLMERSFVVEAVAALPESVLVVGGPSEHIDMDQLASALDVTRSDISEGSFTESGGSLTLVDGTRISFTWTELGAESPTEVMSQLQVYRALPGRAFDLISEHLPVEHVLAVSHTDAGVGLVGWTVDEGGSNVTVLYTDDGVTFEQIETLTTASHIDRISKIRETWVAVGSPRGGNAAVWYSHDGIRFTRARQTWSAFQSLEAFAGGDLIGVATGFVDIRSQTGQLPPGVWMTTDGATWAPRHVPDDLLGIHGHPILGSPAVVNDTVYIIGAEYADMSSGSSDPGTPVLWIGHLEE